MAKGIRDANGTTVHRSATKRPGYQDRDCRINPCHFESDRPTLFSGHVRGESGQGVEQRGLAAVRVARQDESIRVLRDGFRRRTTGCRGTMRAVPRLRDAPADPTRRCRPSSRRMSGLPWRTTSSSRPTHSPIAISRCIASPAGSICWTTAREPDGSSFKPHRPLAGSVVGFVSSWSPSDVTKPEGHCHTASPFNPTRPDCPTRKSGTNLVDWVHPPGVAPGAGE